MGEVFTLMDELRESFVAIFGVEVKSERYSVNTATNVMRMKRGRLKGGSLTILTGWREGLFMLTGGGG